MKQNDYYNTQSVSFELEEKIRKWSDDKGLTTKGTPQGQYEKYLEEVKEFKVEVYKQDREKMKMEFGDVIVTAIMFDYICKQNPVCERSDEAIRRNDIKNTMWWNIYNIASNYKLDAPKCLNMAYEKISKRSGTIKNGTFVKND